MGERGSRKIPVTERQFLWVQDDDKGEVILHVGPTMVSPTAADRVVVDDGQGGFREDTSGQPQRMVELSDAQYAVLSNPMLEKEDGPNGKCKLGRNESKPLRNGTRDMIPGPCSFYLRPGQRVEVRDAHELASNQYLVVKVYGQVDKKAPYYAITAKSAAITTATAEDVTSENSTGIANVEPVDLSRGQLIVIRGLDTQFYIPPTGVDVVPDLSVDEKGTQLTAQAARKILSTLPIPAAPEPAGFMAQSNALVQQQQNEYEDDSRSKKEKARMPVDQAARTRQAVQRAPAPIVAEEAQAQDLSGDDIQVLLASDVHRQALEREVRKSRLVRQAVVLGEKEFCVILDADGKRQIKVGPARVFPGPYDSFMTKGSNNRIYYAYELLPQRALWLRFIAPVSREKLTQRLPRGVELDKDGYFPGDELIMTGVNSFFFPFNEIEILHPLTGRPHVGNDHSDVFIEAIGIDQKSGIYVRDLSTGEVRLVRGKQSYLVDPRKEVHITRTISAEDWNLWIAASEPHKQTQKSITTPWAISINVPHNMAIMAASADGQRVIQGPCVELLLYQETLVPMNLSTGTPKGDTRMMRTCFLRTVGNQVSDVIRLETSDFVQIDVRVSYRVTFHNEHRNEWFNHENYVGVLCDHLRSLVRSRCRALVLSELWPNLPTVIRDIILGEKKEEGGRKGRLFEENGMHVTEVEVLASEILDAEIARLLENVQRESVSLHIADRQASEQLRSEKLRHNIERDRLEMRREAQERQAQLDDIIRRLDVDARLADIRNAGSVSKEQAELQAQREESELKARLGRDLLSLQAHLQRLSQEAGTEVEAAKLRHEVELLHRQALSGIAIAQLEAQSRALVAERQAVQPALVEALTAVGDKMVLSEVAANMNLVSLFKGKDVATIFADVLGGTKVGRTIATLLPEGSRGGHEAGEAEEDA
jgi:major vault protein